MCRAQNVQGGLSKTVYSNLCTAESTFRTYARPSAHFGFTHGRVHVFGRALGWAVRDARLGWRAAWPFVMHGSARHAARLFVVHGLVGVCAWTRPRFGTDARIGCTRAKLYGYD